MGVGARTHVSEVAHLDAINLSSEVSDYAQQGILSGTDVAGTSEPHILAPTLEPRSVAPTSEPWILTPSLDSDSQTKFTVSAYSHLFLLPLGFLPFIESTT